MYCSVIDDIFSSEEDGLKGWHVLIKDRPGAQAKCAKIPAYRMTVVADSHAGSGVAKSFTVLLRVYVQVGAERNAILDADVDVLRFSSSGSCKFPTRQGQDVCAIFGKGAG